MIRGSKKPIPVQREIHCGIHNRFDIEVQDAITGKIRQKARAFNVILNQFWNRATQAGNFGYIWYGNGSGIPAETDTGMFGSSWKVSATDDSTGTDWADGIFWRRKRIQLRETAAVGVNISEVGIGTDTVLCTHALLQDMNGNPITIQKTNTDIITIYATVFVHWNVDGYSNGKIWCASNKLAVTLSDMYFSLSGGDIYNPANNASFSFNSFTLRYDSASRTIISSVGRLAADKGNTGNGLQYARVASSGVIFSLEGAYAIENEAVGTGDGITTDFALDWDIPQNARVYVDGTELTTGFIVNAMPKLNPYFYIFEISPASTKDHVIKYGMTGLNAPGTVGSVSYFYNPYYALGLKSVKARYGNQMALYLSDDFETWTYIGQGNESIIPIPDAYKNSKFLRVNVTSGSTSYSGGIISATWSDDYVHADGKMLHFNTPPAAGAVITADYTCAFVPKDANHVFDFSCVISFGNYEEA